MAGGDGRGGPSLPRLDRPGPGGRCRASNSSSSRTTLPSSLPSREARALKRKTKEQRVVNLCAWGIGEHTINMKNRREVGNACYLQAAGAGLGQWASPVADGQAHGEARPSALSAGSGRVLAEPLSSGWGSPGCSPGARCPSAWLRCNPAAALREAVSEKALPWQVLPETSGHFEFPQLFVPSPSGGPQVLSQDGQGHAPSDAAGEGPPCPRSWGSGVPWLVAAPPQLLPLCLRPFSASASFSASQRAAPCDWHPGPPS